MDWDWDWDWDWDGDRDGFNPNSTVWITHQSITPKVCDLQYPQKKKSTLLGPNDLYPTFFARPKNY